MAKIDTYTITGRKAGQTSLPKEAFGVKPNAFLMAQAVRAYLGNQRQAPAKTKSRGEVICSKRKIWRQKGTGRARHSSRNAPIFVKGAVAHGPTGEQNYRQTLSRKMKRLALRSALTSKLKNKEVIVLQGLKEVKGKTKEMERIVSSFQRPVASVKEKKGKAKHKKRMNKMTIVLPEVWEKVIRAGRNIPYLSFLQAKQLNTYQILNGGVLIFAKESLGVLKEVFSRHSESRRKSG